MSQVLGRPESEQLDGRQSLPRLEPGDHLDQKTFHARYVAMPEDVKAELIGGVVYMPAALGRRHGRHHSLVNYWLYRYEDFTHGVEVYDNATTIMGPESEPQPDVSLIIVPPCGGQMRYTADGYLEGAPELAVEIASSTESYDLHSKKRDYERAGVKEYIALALRQEKVFWFANQDNRFVELSPGADGIYRSAVFPGLWLDADAMLALNSKCVIEVLEQGVAAPEHAEFARRLESARMPRKS